MSLLYHNDTIIKKEKELLRALLSQFCKLEVVVFYTDTSIELRTSLLPFLTSVASTDSLVTLSRILVSNFCPGFQFGLAAFTAAYIADLYCPCSICNEAPSDRFLYPMGLHMSYRLIPHHYIIFLHQTLHRLA